MKKVMLALMFTLSIIIFTKVVLAHDLGANNYNNANLPDNVLNNYHIISSPGLNSLINPPVNIAFTILEELLEPIIFAIVDAIRNFKLPSF